MKLGKGIPLSARIAQNHDIKQAIEQQKETEIKIHK